MRSIYISILLMLALLKIIATGHPIKQQGDPEAIIIIMTGQRVEKPNIESTLEQTDQKPKDRWLKHWVKRILSKKVFKKSELLFRLFFSFMSKLCFKQQLLPITNVESQEKSLSGKLILQLIASLV